MVGSLNGDLKVFQVQQSEFQSEVRLQRNLPRHPSSACVCVCVCVRVRVCASAASPLTSRSLLGSPPRPVPLLPSGCYASRKACTDPSIGTWLLQLVSVSHTHTPTHMDKQASALALGEAFHASAPNSPAFPLSCCPGCPLRL